jgi:hypothetical protein
LSFAVLPRPGWSILSAALFAMLMDNCHMAGEWVIGGVEAKGFAYVLVFLGLESLVKNHWNRAWLLLGAASAIHVLVGGWAAVAALLAWLLIGRGRPGLRSMWPSLLGGLLLALPGLLPALFLNAHADAEIIRQANQIYVFERLPHHLDIFHIYPQFIIRFVFLTLLYFALSWRISLVSGHAATDQPTMPTNAAHRCPMVPVGARRGFTTDAMNNDVKSSIKRFHAFVSGAIAIALAGVVINMLVFFDCDLSAGLLRYYWFRISDVAVPLGVSMLGCWWIVDSRPSRSAIGRFAAVLASLAVIYHFGSLAIQRLQPAAPRAERLANPQAWQEACIWAADERNTPTTARFITPRQAQTFKWYAHRAEVATWKDVPQNAPEIVQWRERMQDLFATDLSDPEYRWYETLNELGVGRIEELGRKYQADFLITESFDPALNLKVVYRNEAYIIYKLRD